MHTICITPQPRCSPTELLKLSIKSSDLTIFDLQNYIERQQAISGSEFPKIAYLLSSM